MRDPDHFDAWYAATRSRVLRQAHALAGDLSDSSQQSDRVSEAVAAAYAAAWQQWDEVEGRPDREAWVRREVVARLGSRPDADGLDAARRHALVLQHLSAVPRAELAAEMGLSPAASASTIDAAEAAYAAARGLSRPEVAADLADRAEAAEALTPPLPPAATIRAAERPRPRQRTSRRDRVVTAGLAVAVVVAAVTMGGVLVSRQVAAPPTTTPSATRSDATPSDATPSEPPGLGTDTLLAASQVARLGPGGRWVEAGTDGDDGGTGRYAPCQTDPSADPDPEAVLVRRFVGRAGGDQRLTAVQATELSRSLAAAREAFATTVGWYAGCTTPRTSLVRTWRVEGVGDQALQFELRRWGPAPQTVTVGVARSGRAVTTTARVVAGPDADTAVAAPGPVARLLGAAAVRLCGEADAGACTGTRPRLSPGAPVALPGARGLLDRVDLPRPGGVTATWSATDPGRATATPAALVCDRTDFSAAPVRGGLTRTFVVLGAGLPKSFGLTENAGRLRSARSAARLVTGIRQRFATCEDDDPASTVTPLTPLTPGADLAAWRVRTEVDDATTVDILTAVVRRGARVAQLGLVTAPGAELDRAAFLALAQRAQQRLAAGT